MSESIYDLFSEEYANMVNKTSMDITSPLGIATYYLISALGNPSDSVICDLGCGEGHLTRRISKLCRQVVGVDISQKLLSVAEMQTNEPNISFVLDDAQVLGTLRDSSFDIVISNLALMDIPDLTATYSSVNRILRSGGRFVFTITHPCFQSPGSNTELDASGRFLSRNVYRYAKEGFWRSDGIGTIRAIAGAYHRTLSTYINELLNAGFDLKNLIEPTVQSGEYINPHAQAQIQVPVILLIDSSKV